MARGLLSAALLAQQRGLGTKSQLSMQDSSLLPLPEQLLLDLTFIHERIWRGGWSERVIQ